MKNTKEKKIEYTKDEYSEGLKIVVLCMIFFALGIFVMGRAIQDGSIPQCNKLLTP